MRRSANVIVAASALVATALCGQTPSPAPGAGAAATGMAQSAPEPNTPAPSAPARSRPNAREPADARVCLEFPDNLQVIRCAEKYRHTKAPA